MNNRTVNEKKSNVKIAVIAACIILLCVIVIGSVSVMGAGKKVVVAKTRIYPGTQITHDNIDELFEVETMKDEVPAIKYEEIKELEGKIIIENINENEMINKEMYASEYPPITKIKEPVVVGIRANDAASFAAGTVRKGDIINVAVIDNLTGECETILDNVYVCGAFCDDGTLIEDEGCAMILNILVDSSMEDIINRKIETGHVRISKTGCDAYDK